MSFWILFDGGLSLAQGGSFPRKFALWCGRRLALRHNNVSIHNTSRISPAARIHPRKGAIKIGAASSIAPGAILQGNITIGKNSSIQAYSVIVGYGEQSDSNGLIQIGDNVRIAPHVMMLSANHVFCDTEKPIVEQGLSLEPITIEDDVWIGGRVNIMAGVKIGRGSVIGAGSVVTKSIPPYSVAVGVPAKVIKNRIEATA